MDISRAEQARNNFTEGYNCAQSVVLAFSDIIKTIDKDCLAALASSFGGGMGRLREVCGAVSGMFIVWGILSGYPNADTGERKAAHYADIQELAHRFERENGTIICRELLGLGEKSDGPIPENRSKEYYEKRPCAKLVYSAAKILDEFIHEKAVI